MRLFVVLKSVYRRPNIKMYFLPKIFILYIETIVQYVYNDK